MAVPETSKVTKKDNEDSEKIEKTIDKQIEPGESLDGGKSKGKLRKKNAKSKEPTVLYETRSRKK